MNHLSPYLFDRNERPDLPLKPCREMLTRTNAEAMYMLQGFQVDEHYYPGGQYLVWQRGKIRQVEEREFNRNYVWT